MKRSTGVLAAVAVASVMLVHLDPWRRPDTNPVGFVSHRSAARRVFPELAEAAPASVRIEITHAREPTLALVPTATGHAVEIGEVRIGPADPDAFDGLMASLRLATTLRAIERESTMVEHDAITVRVGEHAAHVKLGGPSSDGAGLVATLPDGSPWVVERELGDVTVQRPEAWLARRLALLEPREITAVRFPAEPTALGRGPDGSWRSGEGSQAAILSNEAVDARLDRLLRARLDPLVPETARGSPWVELTTEDGRSFSFDIVGPCPGLPGRTHVSRGPGWGGCIDAAILEPWPLPGPGRTSPWIDSHLLPHVPARVLRIEQRAPHDQVLVRHGGDWRLGDTTFGGAAVHTWLDRLHATEVRGADEPPCACQAPDVDLRIETDTTATLELSCWIGRGRCCDEASDEGEWHCRRDGGSWLRGVGPVPALAFTAETFADRKLVTVDPGDALALEIADGGRDTTVRQSVHLDYGVWRLEAPDPPDGDRTLDDTVLEDLLAVLGGLRAEAWTEAPTAPPLRTITLETTPRRDRPAELVIDVHPDCVVVHDSRAAVVAESACRVLVRDLLRTDTIAAWIDEARGLELEGTARGQWTREGERLVQARPDEAANRELARLAGLTVEHLRPGAPDEPPRGTLRVLPQTGPAFMLRYGDGWAHVDGLPWHYRVRPRA